LPCIGGSIPAPSVPLGPQPRRPLARSVLDAHVNAWPQARPQPWLVLPIPRHPATPCSSPPARATLAVTAPCGPRCARPPGVIKKIYFQELTFGDAPFRVEGEPLGLVAPTQGARPARPVEPSWLRQRDSGMHRTDPLSPWPARQLSAAPRARTHKHTHTHTHTRYTPARGHTRAASPQTPCQASPSRRRRMRLIWRWT
jgi:hypothetical protein